jgi:hypothetical protein
MHHHPVCRYTDAKTDRYNRSGYCQRRSTEDKNLEDPKNWIREDLWVETEFDTDGDGPA